MEMRAAKRKVRIAGFFALVATIVGVGYTLYALVEQSDRGALALYNSPFALIDVVVSLLLTIGIWRFSRMAAVAFLLIYFLSRLYFALELGQGVGAAVVLIFAYFLWNGIRGAFAVHRLRKQEEGGYRATRAWHVLVAFPAVIAYLGVLIWLLSTTLGVLPSPNVVEGERFAPWNRNALESYGVLEEDEEIELFYSNSLTSIRKDGNIITDRRVISYAEDEDGEIQQQSADFLEISDARIVSPGNYFNPTIINVETINETKITIFAPTTRSGDWRILQRLKARIASLNSVFLAEGEAAIDAEEYKTAKLLMTRALLTGGLSKEDMFKAYLSRAKSHSYLNDYASAIDDADSAIALNPESFDAHFDRASYFYVAGKYDTAAEGFGAAHALNTKDAGSIYWRGRSYEEQDKHDLAVVDYDRVLEIDPEYAEAYYQRSFILYRGGDADAGITDLNKAIELAPDSAVAYYYRGLMHYYEQANDLALNDYDTALQKDPGYARAFSARGDVFQAQGMLERAMLDYDESVRLDDDEAAYHFNRGTLRLIQGDYENAIADLDAAIERDAGEGAYYTQRCWTRVRLEQYVDALEDCALSDKVRPDNYDTNLLLGDIYYALEQRDKAIERYQSALAIDPTDGNAAERLKAIGVRAPSLKRR
jgi:tetratricopeptide (TPR) repeat protein